MAIDKVIEKFGAYPLLQDEGDQSYRKQIANRPNWSSILVALFLADSSDLTILLVHVSFYLLWFAFLLVFGASSEPAPSPALHAICSSVLAAAPGHIMIPFHRWGVRTERPSGLVREDLGCMGNLCPLLSLDHTLEAQ